MPLKFTHKYTNIKTLVLYLKELKLTPKAILTYFSLIFKMYTNIYLFRNPYHF